ncbi:intraflagellar transport protein like protein [Ditylenchus destructor]|uniref:Intraflagellar transport protein 122 homolog n=1 Tax=Ditylenchus destructor TaxID=166010 RepID=A0AAD4N378_9BILA|nr:intraflagellar transport protein like protein [Ditylenchus destructor]
MVRNTHQDRKIEPLLFGVTNTRDSSNIHIMRPSSIWAQNEKNVSKQKVNSRCTCCAWSSDGQYYAIGFYDGTVSVRSAIGATPTGEEMNRIERPGKEPVWSLQFTLVSSSSGVHGELLVVADWNQSVGFYSHDNGQVVYKTDKVLDYDPTTVHLFPNGCFFLATGSNKKLNLHTKDGGDLGAMAQLDAWPWCMAFRQKPYCVVVGCVDGSLACYQLMLNTIHALHKDRYAFRENQTDVVVQQLQRQKSTRIRCNDLVRKVAIYNNRLAIQLTDKVLVYRQSSGDKEGEPLDYKLLDRINQSFDCSLLVVCTNHVILCQDRRLTCYDLKGIKQREWIMESMIRYIKVVGGPPGRETILVGMRYGVVSKIFVDNPFPVEVVRLKSMIRCVDISLSKRKLATVDEEGICVIYDTETKEILNQEPNMSSVAFNCENDDLVCYSGFGTLNIKSHWFTPYQQRLEPSHQGFVVGFMGKCVYILHMYSMQCLEIPLTSQLLQFLDHKMFREAYDLASLGVTERDWKMLGSDALEHMEFPIAKKAFYRIRDCRSLLLINELEEMHIRGCSLEEMRAVLYAHTRRFREAAQLLQAMNAEQRALEMFADLRMFDQAQEFLANSSPETQKQLLRRKAEWAHNSNDMVLAADIVINAARKLDRSEANLLREIGNYLAKKREFTAATTIFNRINDVKSIINMHMNAGHWEDALALAERNPSMNADVYLPYARWLAERDRFDEAQLAYSKAGHDQEALQVLEQLTENAVQESRFADASYYYRIMVAQLLTTQVGELDHIENRWRELSDYADIYYAYEPLFKYVIEPFTNKSLDILFNMARYLALHREVNYVSRVIVLFTLVKLSRTFANYKTARQALEQLRLLRAPTQYQSLIDIATLEIRAKPFSDTEEFQPMCYSCGTSNPILGAHSCVHCDAEFVYSFATFEVLPIIEFGITEDLTIEEAIHLIDAEPTSPGAFNIGEIAMNKQRTGIPHLNRHQLTELDRNLVFICVFPQPAPWLRTRFYIKVISEINISKCDNCQKMFHSDDFQMAILQYSQCPVCRFKIHIPDVSSEVDEIDKL